jgi:phytoene desaturase
MSKKNVIIIGAGIGGIATAALLAKAGFKVDVYEKNERAGGRADTFSEQGFRFDMGPSWYLMSEVFEHFYDLMDEDITKHLDLIRLDPAYKVFFEGAQKPVVVTSDLSKDTVTFEAIEKGAGKKLRSYVLQGSKIYSLSLKHFLYSNFSSISDLLKRDVLGNGITMMKLAFTPIHGYIKGFVKNKRLQQILEYPMVFLGTSPFKAPAIYSLMSALDFQQGVFYPKGGLYEVIKSLVTIAEKRGVTFHYNTPISSIVGNNGKATGVTLLNKSVVVADIIISNADLHFTETQLVAPAFQTYPEKYWKNKQAGPSALLLYLGIDGKIPTLEHHNLLFVDEWKENFAAIFESKTVPPSASIYICKPSGIDSGVAPEGKENLFVLVPLPAGLSLNAKAQSDLVDRYLKQISTMVGIPDLISRIVFQQVFGPNDFMTKFHSWQSTALGPSHILRQSAFFRSPNISKKLDNLYYVGGSTTPGIGLPMCLISAELVYKRLAGDKKGGMVKEISIIRSSS